MLRWIKRLFRPRFGTGAFTRLVDRQLTKGQCDQALEHIEAELARNPHADLFTWRGTARYLKEDFQRAIADCTKALKMGTMLQRDAFGIRGLSWLVSQQFQAAVDDFSAAIEADPNRGFDQTQSIGDYPLHRLRCFALTQMGEDGRAKADLKVVVTQGKRNLGADYQLLALLCSVSTDAGVRCGEEAVMFAEKVGSMTEWKQWVSFSILAAAWAEFGDFDQAVRAARQAVDLAPPEMKETRQERVRLFESRRPLRMTPVIEYDAIDELLPHRVLAPSDFKKHL